LQAKVIAAIKQLGTRQTLQATAISEMKTLYIITVLCIIITIQLLLTTTCCAVSPRSLPCMN